MRTIVAASLVAIACGEPPATVPAPDGGSRADEYGRPCSGGDPCAAGFVCSPVGGGEDRTCANARVVTCASYWSEAEGAACGRAIYGSRSACFTETRLCFNDELDQVPQCWEKLQACSLSCLPACALAPPG